MTTKGKELAEVSILTASGKHIRLNEGDKMDPNKRLRISEPDSAITDIIESLWETIPSNLNQEIIRRCLQFCYLFPRNYEFYEDDLIHLWIAQELIIPVSMEDAYFREFERLQIFTVSDYDSSICKQRYKLNYSIFDLLQKFPNNAYVRMWDENSYLSKNTLHCSCEDSSIIDPIALKELYQAKNLFTLLMFHEPGTGTFVAQVPRELFMKLPMLRVLDLSYTYIKELPSSVGKLRELRYLNLSGTLVTTLPNSLCNLYKMQCLKLRGCLKICDLPKDIRKLINLQHLDVDVACLLNSMPYGFGDLSALRSLSAFVVGKCDGCRVGELKNLHNLAGTIRIMRLENVLSYQEAKEAALDQKKYIRKLELQWTELQDGLEVLENLQPHKNLTELQIVGYGGVKFPDWVGDPVFSRLGSITIHDCKKCQHLPPFGKLPFLCILSVSEMHEIKVIDHQFYGRDAEVEGLDFGRLELGTVSRAFPRLEKLTLSGMPTLVEWSGMKEGDFPPLTNTVRHWLLHAHCSS